MQYIVFSETLTYLGLVHNRLSQVPSEALQGLNGIKELNLRLNNIGEIKDEAFKGFGNNIIDLKLGNNR